MIIFEKIRYKNILSTGNVFTEINLNDTPNAILIGRNGSGKSTFLDALTFVLFGKPFRKINKSNLINSINDKNCVVEIEFSTNGKKYKIIRGIKPNIFEIWCDSVFLNKDSSSKDYQEYLEKFILRMGYKSFCQIVILGSASFVPFMQLTPSDRRIIIEDLLDIQVFSIMNGIVKQRATNNKENLERNKIEFIGKEEKKSFIEKTIKSLKQNNTDKKQKLKDEYESNKQEINELQREILIIEDQIKIFNSDINCLENIRKKHNKLLVMKTKIEANKNKCIKESDFYHNNEDCPTCRQSIASEFRQNEISKLVTKLSDYEEGIKGISIEIDKCLDEINRLTEISKQISVLQAKISAKTAIINTLINKQSKLINDVETVDKSDSILQNNIDELSTVISTLETLEKQKQEFLEEKKYIETATNLLKDGGIKTKIIKQYLPIINKMINKYLAQMDFFASFHINKNFEEVIKSRYLEEFSYQNFSEGEKTRIDLAILFTWRYIAKMRNSVNCNLLIFDEIFDGSLDSSGTDEFLNIMWNLAGDTNTFVISHKIDQLVDKFKKVYRFDKKKNYSYVVTTI